MKQLSLHNKSFTLLELSFKEYLQTLGYTSSSVKGLPLMVKEFLHFLEQENLQHITEVNSVVVHLYFENLEKRLHATMPKNLSVNYINKHLQVLRLFSKYLRQCELGGFAIEKTAQKAVKNPHQVLTKDEINTLYNSITSDAYGCRDKAILALYYGAGLRRTEGVQIDVNDVLFEHGLIYVRKGKNYTERYVPVNAKVLKDLSEYAQTARQWFKYEGKEQDAFLISLQGNRLDGMSACLRIKVLQKASDNTALQNKKIGLHSLRHSIATHLLQQGMPLQKIAQFLGHKTIESTQIYTHLAEELNQAYESV